MGHFRFGSLRPGEYRVAAWEKVEAGMGNIPEFHARFDDRATTIKLREDSHETVQPVLIDRDQVMLREERLELAPEKEIDPTQQDRRHPGKVRSHD